MYTLDYPETCTPRGDTAKLEGENALLSSLSSGACGFLELRAFDQIARRLARRWWIPLPFDPAELHRVLAEAREVNSRGAAISVGVNPRVRQSGKNTDVEFRVALVADIDPPNLELGSHALDRLSQAGLAPSAVVLSGRGWHLYYLLASPVPNDARSAAVARRLCCFLHSDHVHDAARVLRLPGTWNWKNPSRPLPCWLQYLEPHRRYSLEQVEAALDAVGAPREQARCRSRLPSTSSCRHLVSPPRPPPPPPPGLSEDLLGYARNGAPRGERSERDIALVRALAVAGWSDEQIFSLFLSYPSGCGAKTREQGLDYLSLTISNARRHIRRGSANAVPAVIEGVDWSRSSAELSLGLRLLDGSNAVARARVALSNCARWSALWSAVELLPPADPAEASSAARCLRGQQLRVTTVQRPRALAVTRFFPATPEEADHV